MPGGDRTGPRGLGPRSGRGAGYCAGYDMPGFANPAPGYGGRFGGGFGFRGGGRGWGRGWGYRSYAANYPNWVPPSYPPVTQEQELAGLKDEADWLKGQLEEINRRIGDLERKE
jgi:hypothetical protein